MMEIAPRFIMGRSLDSITKYGEYLMAKFTSPADAALAIAEERRLYHAQDDARMDVRLAKREGDDTAVAVAEKAAADAATAWYAAFKFAQTGIKATIEACGLDPAAIKMYL